ncbi:lytic transglycosylase domain-containing protein [Amycolatopsis acidicola]|uniref:Lytic transglycosylase domain-containing protein n=1 Tax=Amycolatopsis acidicola TaxID=2596893 RepID=A0A5N0V8K8_9PSEU|nr:lytic transglycosylase domain-containing protein [Amycolatopsis acidicola]KAA9162014.1 lytic transglycosylase domain-containing protein [Amycolatopsis acidicola]
MSRGLRAKQGAFLVVAALLAPFFPTSTVDTVVVGVDGEVAAQPELSPQVLADAANPPALSAGLPSFADVPMGSMPATLAASALDAYHKAAATMARLAPGCHLDWSLLAAIGHVESGGSTAFPILGPVLDGNGYAAVPDTDGGALDGNAVWDRAVGPMQFIPSSWAKWASDGNGDGIESPHDLYDAALAAGRYLCAGGGDLRDPRQAAQAVFRYNHSDSYVRTVLLWADAYARGTVTLPDSAFQDTSYGAAPLAGSAGLPAPAVVPAAPPVAPAVVVPPVVVATPPATTPPSSAPPSSSATPPPSTTTTTPPPTTEPPTTTLEPPLTTTTTTTTTTTPATTAGPSTTDTTAS